MTPHKEEQSMKAIRVYEFGGPEVLRYEEVPDPTPDHGGALVPVGAAASAECGFICRLVS